MRKRDFFTYLFLGIALAAAVTFIWNYKTTLPWITGRISSALLPVIGGICIGFIMNIPASFLEKKIRGCRNSLLSAHSMGIGILVSILLLVLFLAAGGHILVRGFDDKIRTRCHLRFFVLLSVCLFLYVFLQPQRGICLVPVLAACTGVLAGHLFVLAGGRASNAFFIGVLLAAAGLYAFELWMQLG